MFDNPKRIRTVNPIHSDDLIWSINPCAEIHLGKINVGVNMDIDASNYKRKFQGSWTGSWIGEMPIMNAWNDNIERGILDVYKNSPDIAYITGILIFLSNRTHAPEPIEISGGDGKLFRMYFQNNKNQIIEIGLYANTGCIRHIAVDGKVNKTYITTLITDIKDDVDSYFI